MLKKSLNVCFFFKLITNSSGICGTLVIKNIKNTQLIFQIYEGKLPHTSYAPSNINSSHVTNAK